MLPVIIPNLPFGGVGQSGIGKFHGEEGFRNFSNQKSITFKSFLFDSNLRYPPYERVKKFLKFIFQVWNNLIVFKKPSDFKFKDYL